MRYTVTQFRKDFPNDDVCLQTVFDNRYGDVKHCPKCAAETKFHRVTGRKCYACQWCGYQLHPLAQTIFAKSETPLTSWFYAIYLFSVSKNGVAAKELERHLGVTYKTAHRMARQIRELMKQDGDILTGTVEMDETYMGGKSKGQRGRGAGGKVPVFGMVERDGAVKAVATKAVSGAAVKPLIRQYVDVQAIVNTDSYHLYKGLPAMGYSKHEVINHSNGEYVRGAVHTNTIEGFWGQLKRSINGTYHMVSPKYLQSYVDEFAFRYNFRGVAVYPVLLERAAKPF